MERSCPRCGAPLPPNEQRCGRCGTPFDPLAGGVYRAENSSARQQQTRKRQATVSPTPVPYAGSPYEPIGVMGWFGIFLLMLLPGVNIILLIVWACGGCRKLSKKNFARAALIILFFALFAFVILWLWYGSFWTRLLDILYYYW